ncbi:MAG: bifunctional acyl-ACP--phospholipid O-acyltransferase/long-chain-fatty-acid--ACP ligase [Burkholderiales bacterium]|jgi:acyl-[acyl-carrier-protein]-phospholipid O-acyltransferase/long-chain-fatty-acid--[acyl-carrier-protein] ligase|nr:bifunctional acyl-ACP--phospholipid O-acyltransferase/long-chain-fatty-acid--ACP ligase [Burkholderiales bacterium]
MKIIIRITLKLWFRVRVNGRLDVFNHARTLIVANHESLIDGVLLALMLPIEPIFIVHSTVVKHPFFSRILRYVRHYAVDTTNPMAMKSIIKLVEAGEPVVIFPEGRVTTTGSLMKVYEGASFIAAKTGATIVPIRIEGALRSWFNRLGGAYPRQLFPKITLHIMEPRFFPSLKATKTRERREEAGKHMRALLTEMLVQTHPYTTLYQAYLNAMRYFGRDYKLVEDVQMREETYSSLLKKAFAIARVSRCFTEKNEYVGVMLPNVISMIATFLGLSISNRIPALLNYTSGDESIRSSCHAAKIHSIITSREFLKKTQLTHLPEKIAHINWYYLEDLREQITMGDKLWIVCCMLSPHWARDPQQKPSSPALALFTSGSEGRPKGVVHSHDSILANVAQLRAVLDFTPLDKFMAVLPLFHSFGLTVGAILPLMSGCKIFLYTNPLHYRIVPELIYDRDCTVLFGSSTFLANYAKYAHPYDFGRLRYVIAGAEKLDESVRATYIERYGINIFEGYGVTECAPVISVNTPMASRNGSVGQIVPAMQGRIQPTEGVPENTGVLEVRGPNVMLGYLRYENPGVLEWPSASGESSWHSTGDVVSIDDEGFVYIRGRLKRFAKLAGEMVSLEITEALANQASREYRHGASIRPDATRGESIVLFTTDATLTREMLIVVAHESGASELAIPREIRVIDSIPLLGTGKTDYVTLQEMALQ